MKTNETACAQQIELGNGKKATEKFKACMPALNLAKAALHSWLMQSPRRGSTA
jgi:hypothetical protein